MKRLITATATLAAAVVAMAGMTATADASWNFREDQRTCHTPAMKIVTNEDECIWPAEVASQAFVYGMPKHVTVGSHRYVRTYVRYARRYGQHTRARYETALHSGYGWESGPIWFRVTTKTAA